MTSSSIASILESSAALGKPIHVLGTSPLAQALILKAWIEKKQRSVIVLCPNEEKIDLLYEDLKSLNQSAHIFTTWENSPYSSLSLGIKPRLSRLNCLYQTQNTEPSLFLTTPTASLQRTLPFEVFKKLSITLSVGQALTSREELISQLTRCGYLRVEPVEDPGTFSVRGEIVDVYSPHQEVPYRIEFFDNEIEKIRFFDPDSQKTLKDPEPKTIQIIPARETIINNETAPLLRKNLKLRADELGIPRSIRDPILESVESGYYTDHSDLWVHYAYSETSTLFDYFKHEADLIWSDELFCKQNLDQHFSELKKQESSLSSSGVIAPKPVEIYASSSDLDDISIQSGKLFFDSLEFTQTAPSLEEAQETAKQISESHRIWVENGINGLDELTSKIPSWLEQRWKIQVYGRAESTLQRVSFIFSERGWTNPLIQYSIADPSSSLRWPAEGLILLKAEEVLGTHKQKNKSSDHGSKKNWSGLKSLSDLSVGDAVVHIDHGIGVYQGLTRIQSGENYSEFLILEYAGRDKLYLPVYRLNLIQKHHGGSDHVSLDRLGNSQFEKTKQKVKDSLRKMAIDLIDLYAKRSLQVGTKLIPHDENFQLFQNKFIFEETTDQQRAIDDCIDDLSSGRLMDRLICGDVGFGKTEVAMRAAFLAVSSGKQVAVLVPTTVLCHQHELSFRSRMKDFAIRIESLSRFKTAAQQKEALRGLADGKVDIIIGTHRLLSRDVKFKDLGLVIVDEEHRFGVEHKEKLKTLKLNTHVLAMTATPIPRTMQMTMSGLRDISIMSTPPVDRLPIRTFVSKFDEEVIKKAIEFELSRGGQVFFIHNRVQAIHEIASSIAALVPQAKIGVGHAQMEEGALEKTMLDFFEKRTNVLVCTTIVESGLDVPSANTIIINRADALGLAQLYQLRGRVGRSSSRAYAYLLVSSTAQLTEEARMRLDVIQRFVELGSGFNIASYDLEIRGGGNLLGAEQSGQIAAVGFELYTQLLEEAVAELRGQVPTEEESRKDPEIKVPFSAYLDESYIADVHQRLSLYRRISSAKNESELLQFEEDLRDRYGTLPEETQNLLWVIRLKIFLKKLGVDTFVASREKATMTPGKACLLEPSKAIQLMAKNPSLFQLMPDSKMVVKIPTPNMQRLYFHIEETLKSLINS